MVDVVSRRCEEAECRRRPLYGHEGEKGRFCSYHKARRGCSRNLHHSGSPRSVIEFATRKTRNFPSSVKRTHLQYL